MPSKKHLIKKSISKKLSSKNQNIKSKIESASARHLKRKKKFKTTLIILVIALAVIIVALLNQLGIIESQFKNPLAEPQEYFIEDRCSLIVGQLIHTIGDSDTCELRCKTECEVRKQTYHDSKFTEIEEDCNSCNCFCR